MTRALPFLVVALWAVPAAAQTGDGPGDFAYEPVSPDTVLAGLWAEALGGARAAADNLDGALFDDSVAVAEGRDGREAAFRRAVVVASQGAAAAAAHVGAATQMAIALAPAERQEATEAALSEPAVWLYEALLTVVVEARDAVDAPPGEAPSPAEWREAAAFVRQAADALAAAVTAGGR